MNRRKLSAGDIIEASCTRCRKILNHTIVAMVEERVVRVECNTCHGVHNYREKVEAKAKTSAAPVRKAAASPRQTAKQPASVEREEWESLFPAMERERSIPYDINGGYQVNDLVDHPVFGLGIVKSVIRPNKMEVLFQQGKKLLRCR